MKSSSRPHPAARPDHAGTALIVVLVVIVILSLAAYTFSELMLVESQATNRYGRDVQARSYADSGVELVAAQLGTLDPEAPEDLFHNPELFSGVLLRDGDSDWNRGRVSLISPVEADSTSTQIRFGLQDESARINLNAISQFGLTEEQERNLLMNLPGMFEELADAVLDWVDADDTPRDYGAESESYVNVLPPNGPLTSLDELLYVVGVTPDLLYGEDANRNGLLDPNENDGDLTPPLDDADGLLNPGWSALLTVYSRETNLRSDGTEKINVNLGSLVDLYDTLEPEFGEQIAQFIVAYRLYGPIEEEEEQLIAGRSSTDSGEDCELSASSASQSASNTTGDAQTDEELATAAAEVAGNLLGGEGATITRAGLNLLEVATTDINSLYDLIDAKVLAKINEEDVELPSPFTSDPAALTQDLPLLLGSLSTTDAAQIEGRINVNEARLEVLLGLPCLSEETAYLIVASQPVGTDGRPTGDAVDYRSTTGWLLVDGLMSLSQLRLLDRFMTTRGSVYRMQSVGHFDEGGPIARVEAVIDAAQVPPRIVFQRDLSQLGPGFRLDQLSQSSLP